MEPYIDQKRPQVGAGAVIIKDGMTLLAKRKGSHSSEMWGSMGGHVEFGETPIEAVKREAKEELDIEIGDLKFLTCTNLIKGEKHYLDIMFTAELVSGVPTIMEPDKIETIGWYPLDQLPSPLFEPIKIALEAVRTGQSYFEIGTP